MTHTVYRAFLYALAGVLAITGCVFSTILTDFVGAREIGLAALLGFTVVWCAHEATSHSRAAAAQRQRQHSHVRL